MITGIVFIPVFLDIFYLERKKEINKELMDRYLFQNLNQHKFKMINEKIKLNNYHKKN